MRKLLFVVAVLCILTPLTVYTGKALGWWIFPHDLDILAHSSVSFGLALMIGFILRERGIRPSYLNVVLPVVLLGLSWELGQLVLGLEKSYISNTEALKDLSIDLVGAMIGAEVLRDVTNKRG